MTIEETEEILLLISDKLNDEGSAIDAFTKLYKGYGKFLLSVISSSLKNMGIYDEHLSNSVLNNTFCIVYKKPLSFSFPQGATDNKSFKAWLSAVAKNELKRLLADYFGKETTLELVTEDPLIESEELSSELFESVNLKMMNDALNSLSQRDREILISLYLYYEDGKKTPSQVLDMLCKTHDTTKENIRKIKQRSEQKIIEYFSKCSQLKPLKNVR